MCQGPASSVLGTREPDSGEDHLAQEWAWEALPTFYPHCSKRGLSSSYVRKRGSRERLGKGPGRCSMLSKCLLTIEMFF